MQPSRVAASEVVDPNRRASGGGHGGAAKPTSTVSRQLIDRIGWSKSGARICAELRSTASNGPDLHRRDRRVPGFRRSRTSADQPGGQGGAGSNRVVPTARSGGIPCWGYRPIWYPTSENELH